MVFEMWRLAECHTAGVATIWFLEIIVKIRVIEYIQDSPLPLHCESSCGF
jgi:hypothetical protein